MPTRGEMWQRLDEKEHDLLVIGGGIVGCGVARDAAKRGLSVALVEMKDLAWGTSSRSSKLVHGGVRYLEQYEFSLVFESVSERRVLMDLAPHLVNPLGFILPVYKNSKHKLWFINAGMWLYDGLSLFRSPKIHRKLKPDEVAELEPALKQEGLTGAPLYYDCATDDARLTLETALDAAGHGALISTWSELTELSRDEHGRVCGGVVKDVFTGQTKQIKARAVVNATGPWTDALLGNDGVTKHKLLRTTKGIHIVVDSKILALENAVVCAHPKDKRVLFAIPWGERTYIGTTDTDWSGDPADVYATSDEVDYLIDAVSSYFPKNVITRKDVISTWAGIRPLIAPPEAEKGETASEVSREHEVRVGKDALITIAGGKLTTHRLMALETVDKAVQLLSLTGGKKGKAIPASTTGDDPLPGAVGWPANDDHEEVASIVEATAKGRISHEIALHLTNTYGMCAVQIAEQCAKDKTWCEQLIPGRPEIVGQIHWAVTQELAETLWDFMIRRTQIYYRDVNQGLVAAPAIAAHMGKLLGWDDARTKAEIATYENEVAKSRRWKEA